MSWLNPFNFNPFQIGLVSIAGMTGAIASFGVGKLQDKVCGIQATGSFIGISLISMVLSLFAGGSIVLIVIAAALYSLGVQGVGILNQARALALDPTKSSRLNTAFVFNNSVSNRQRNLRRMTSSSDRHPPIIKRIFTKC